MKKKLLNIIIKERTLIATSVVALFCIFSFALFTVGDSIQNATSMIVFFCIIPFLYIKFILKGNMSNFGLTIGNWKKGLSLSVISLVVFFAIFLLLFYKTSLTDDYFISDSIRSNFIVFVFYQFFRAILLLIFFELFFRGFLMFSFAKKFKLWSILLQAVVFISIILFLGGSYSQYFLLILSALFSGIIAYYSRSLLYSFVTTVFFIFICEAYMIKFVI